MQLIVEKWNPDRKHLSLELPVGARCINARMTVHGDVRAVFVAPDGVTEKAPYRLAIIKEPTCLPYLDGTPDDWDYIGSWPYPNGDYAHAFAPAKVRKKPGPKPGSKRAPIDTPSRL